MIPGENNAPPVRPDTEPMVDSPVTPPSTQLPTNLPRPKFPQVGSIPSVPFDIHFTPRVRDTTVPPHAFYGKRVSDGVLIYPGILNVFIADLTAGSGASPPGFTTWGNDIYPVIGMSTGEPVLVSAAEGDAVCLCFDITAATNVVTNVRVEVATPAMTRAQDGGTVAVEIGQLTATGFTQKLRSDFCYTSLIST